MRWALLCGIRGHYFVLWYNTISIDMFPVSCVSLLYRTVNYQPSLEVCTLPALCLQCTPSLTPSSLTSLCCPSHPSEQSPHSLLFLSLPMWLSCSIPEVFLCSCIPMPPTWWWVPKDYPDSIPLEYSADKAKRSATLLQEWVISHRREVGAVHNRNEGVKAVFSIGHMRIRMLVCIPGPILPPCHFSQTLGDHYLSIQKQYLWT